MEHLIILWKDKLQKEALLVLAQKAAEAGIDVKCLEVGAEYTIEKSGLYITDCSDVVAELKNYNLAVLGYLHEACTFLEVDYAMEHPEEIDVCYLERIYRRCRNLPWNILETERCVIRETVEEDVDAFWEIYSHPEITKYTEALYSEKEQELEYIKRYIDTVYRYFEFGIWTVLDKGTGDIIGRAGFNVREGYDLPELGFVIGVPWQRKGVAYEICRAILRYGKEELGFEQVQALVMPENNASLSLCHKLGFREQERVIDKGQEYRLLTVTL